MIDRLREHNCKDSVSARARLVFAHSESPHSWMFAPHGERALYLLVETHFWFRNRTSACANQPLAHDACVVFVLENASLWRSSISVTFVLRRFLG